MTEEITELSNETYKTEALYMEARQRQSDSFDEMLSAVPEEKEDIREAMRSLWNAEPDKLLNPDKLAELKERNEPLFREVSTYYMGHLKRKLGID